MSDLLDQWEAEAQKAIAFTKEMCGTDYDEADDTEHRRIITLIKAHRVMREALQKVELCLYRGCAYGGDEAEKALAEADRILSDGGAVIGLSEGDIE